MIVRELELDLDAFEGPFDLLLALVLKEELDLRDIDLAGIVATFLERLMRFLQDERGRILLDNATTDALRWSQALRLLPHCLLQYRHHQ